MTFARKIFDFRGRLRRRDYWLLSILVGIVVYVSFLAVRRGLGFDEDELPIWWTSLVTLWPSAAITVKRLHDRNRSGWLAIPLLLPIATGLLLGLFPDPRLEIADRVFSGLMSLWMLVDLGILDGTKGPNRYGPSPKGIGPTPEGEISEVFA